MINFDNELNNSKNDFFYYSVDLLVNVEILKISSSLNIEQYLTKRGANNSVLGTNYKSKILKPN